MIARSQGGAGDARHEPLLLTRLLRKVLSYPAAREAAASLGAYYIDFVFWTTRWRFLEHKLAEFGAADRPVIFCSWHGRQLMMPRLWPVGARLSVLGSTSVDGQLALAIARQFGFDAITLQKSDLGLRTVGAILGVLKSGKSIGVTPDGSRGPRMNVNPGVVYLARISGAPIIPAAYSCSSAIVFPSWDRFLAPLPFGRGIFVVGEPILVPKTAGEAEMETAREMLETALNALTKIADVAVGRKPIAPAKKAAIEGTGQEESA